MDLLLNGHQVAVDCYGPPGGRPVVFLHHGLGAAAAWKAQESYLAGCGYRVIAYDRWGYGRSGPRASLGIPYFASDRLDLESLLDSLGIEQVALVGHSDGGTIALYFAAEHGERVKALVVIAAHVYLEEGMKAGIRGVEQSYRSSMNFRKGLHRIHGEQAEAVFIQWHDGWTGLEGRPEAAWDLRPQLRKILCPTLVIQGQEDEHASPQHARDLAAAVPQAELWLVPGARHMLPQEQPQVLNPRLLDFLQAHG